MSDFTLKFPLEMIPFLAKRYDDDDRIPESIGPRCNKLKYLTKDDFLSLCAWKTQRSKSRVASNSEELVREVTSIALTAASEEIRIGVLTLLKGVQFPTASVILHFVHDDPYPILDRRALWSLSIDDSTTYYTFPFWRQYVQVCRAISEKTHFSMRVVDRALWQYSFENQVRL